MRVLTAGISLSILDFLENTLYARLVKILRRRPEIHLSPTGLASPLPTQIEIVQFTIIVLANPRLGSGSHDPEMDPA
jgi:hypothetical protein